MATSTVPHQHRETRDSVVIRFAGDSGDGMQVTGSQFTLETALAGSDFSTFPDFPAEIRAPTGTTFGVSAFQIHFGSTDVMTPGDAIDVLVAMNPAALTVELKDLKVGGTVIVDTDAFYERNLSKAGYARSPLEDDSLARYQVLKFDIAKLTADAVKPHGLSSREARLCRNMWALGLLLWMYGYDRTASIDWLKKKFAKKPMIADANIAALNAGHAFGETAAMTEHLVGIRAAAFAGAPARLRRRHVPGRGRNRGRGRGVGRVVCGRARCDVELRSRYRAEDRDAGSRDRDGAAARRHRLAARGAVDRDAHEGRAVRPLPGSARPQRRCPARRPRANDDGRLLRHRHGVGSARDEVHDTRHGAVRRVPRARRRAVADSARSRPAAFPDQLSHRPGGISSVPSQSRDARAAVGKAGHAGARAPHGRARARLRQRAHLLRSGQPRAHDPGAGRQDRRNRARHSRASGGAR